MYDFHFNVNYTFIFPNFTILFLFLYFFVLIPSVLKNAFNVWKYTSNNDQKNVQLPSGLKKCQLFQ